MTRPFHEPLPDVAEEVGFDGEALHSGEYKSPDFLRGKRVLVVGAGNSGCDIAVESAQHAAVTYHSTRRGYHYLPKFLFGLPIPTRWFVPLQVAVAVLGFAATADLGGMVGLLAATAWGMFIAGRSQD